MDFNTDQFRQPAFRGFGDQAMRRHRVTPAAPQPAPATPQAPSAGHQESLFQAAEVQGQTPPPTFNPAQFRRAQYALPGMSNAAMRGQRSTPAPAPPASAPATPSVTSGPGWSQPQISMLGPSPSSPSAPGAAGPTPTRWPSPTPAPSTPAPSGPGRTVTINAGAYRNAGPSRPAAAAPAAAPSRAPATPPRPSAPPTAGPRLAARPPGRGSRALPLAGTAVTLAGRSLQGITKIATDPKRSGNPLYKTSRGWNKA
ncbi:hypothetical protein [Streptomyces sp. MMBL 11-1]|uniref:hypothetical protein n=1 Tax=Streptomyces sp. MMBL 11-1 TaxID=3026420 RepID=UPI00236298A2|nr:hypothetical protein [Streptomyces sp. MMBL 11-1]